MSSFFSKSRPGRTKDTSSMAKTYKDPTVEDDVNSLGADFVDLSVGRNEVDNPPQYTPSAADMQEADVQTLQIRPDDIIISVMGITGSGKSTFISHFCEGVPIGTTLEACTGNVGMYACQYNENTRIIFVDTPGFDDTYKSDTDILREIANWLSQAHVEGLKLSGIIYLHRIMDVRLGGSAMKNLRMFKKLVGADALSSVVLATTFWGETDEATGTAREKQLASKDDFWAAMIKKGSRMFRQDDDLNSAKTIVDYLLDKKQPVTLDIQREMVDQKLTLDQTGAGIEVDQQLAKVKLQFEEQMADMRAEYADMAKRRDEAGKRELAEFMRATEERMRIEEENRAKLHANMEELRKQRENEMAEERKHLMEEIRSHTEAMLTNQYELEKLKLAHSHEMKAKELSFKLQMQEQENARLRDMIPKKKTCVVM